MKSLQASSSTYSKRKLRMKPTVVAFNTDSSSEDDEKGSSASSSSALKNDSSNRRGTVQNSDTFTKRANAATKSRNMSNNSDSSNSSAASKDLKLQIEKMLSKNPAPRCSKGVCWFSDVAGKDRRTSHDRLMHFLKQDNNRYMLAYLDKHPKICMSRSKICEKIYEFFLVNGVTYRSFNSIATHSQMYLVKRYEKALKRFITNPNDYLAKNTLKLLRNYCKDREEALRYFNVMVTNMCPDFWYLFSITGDNMYDTQFRNLMTNDQNVQKQSIASNSPFSNSPFSNSPFSNSPLSNTNPASTTVTDIEAVSNNKNKQQPWKGSVIKVAPLPHDTPHARSTMTNTQLEPNNLNRIDNDNDKTDKAASTSNSAQTQNPATNEAAPSPNVLTPIVQISLERGAIDTTTQQALASAIETNNDVINSSSNNHEAARSTASIREPLNAKDKARASATDDADYTHEQSPGIIKDEQTPVQSFNNTQRMTRAVIIGKNCSTDTSPSFEQPNALENDALTKKKGKDLDLFERELALKERELILKERELELQRELSLAPQEYKRERNLKIRKLEVDAEEYQREKRAKIRRLELENLQLERKLLDA